VKLNLISNVVIEYAQIGIIIC